eukprot:6941245-Alexandrium_andersonii.AAC.1
MHEAVADWAIVEAERDSDEDDLAGEDLLSGCELPFARQFKDGLDEFFICRNAQCAFVGRNADWARTLLSGGY